MNGLSAAASAAFLVAAFACQVRISYAFLYQVDASRPKGRFLNASCPTNGVSHQQDDICPQYSLPPIRHSVSVFSRLLHSEESGIFPEGDTTSIKSRELSNLPRLYTGPSIFGQAESTLSIAKGTRIQLSAEQSHYLKNVMRIFKKKQRKKTLAGANDTLSRCVRIFDGKSGEWLARVFETPEVSAQHGEGGGTEKRRRRGKTSVEKILRAECIVQLREQESQKESPLPWMIFAPIKKHRAKLMVEKCTELGTGLFIPVVSKRADTSAVRVCSSLEGLDKLAIHALEAAEQCESLVVPKVLPNLASEVNGRQDVLGVEQLLNLWKESEESISQNRTLLICRERSGGTAILQTLRKLQGVDAGIAFLVGPEGGWSPEEELLFDTYRSQSDQICCVSLGSSVLRAETAAMMAVGTLAMHQAASGESS